MPPPKKKYTQEQSPPKIYKTNYSQSCPPQPTVSILNNTVAAMSPIKRIFLANMFAHIKELRQQTRFSMITDLKNIAKQTFQPAMFRNVYNLKIYNTVPTISLPVKNTKLITIT